MQKSTEYSTLTAHFGNLSSELGVTLSCDFDYLHDPMEKENREGDTERDGGGEREDRSVISDILYKSLFNKWTSILLDVLANVL